jgi:hypothetical protein
MALLHHNTSFCLGTQLDLFSVPGTQTSQEKNAYFPHYPVSSLEESGTIEFDIKPSSHYTDLSSTRLYIKAKIDVESGNLPATDKATPVNMLMHALFSKVDVFVGEKMVTQSSGTYPWKAGIETLLNFGTDAKASHLWSSIMYSKDTAGRVDDTNPDDSTAMDTGGNVVNQGLKQRHERTKGGKEFELYAPLHVDFFMQPKYLISQVPIRIRLIRNPATFCLMSASGTTRYKINILNAALWVRRVSVSASVEVAHAKVLQNSNALYPIHRVEMEQVSVPVGTRAMTRDNFFAGRVPTRLVVGLLSNEAVNGSLTKSPFHFQSFGLENLELSLDGEPAAGTPMSFDFTNKLYTRGYENLFEFLNKSYKDAGLDITYEDFGGGHALFCFDLTADGCGNCSDHVELTRNGNLRLKLGFKNNLTETINVMLYGEFESCIEITKQREVLVDYRL